MHILLLDREGKQSCLAMRLADSGHTVDLFSPLSWGSSDALSYEGAADGWAHAIKAWRPLMATAGLILADQNMFNQHWDVLQKYCPNLAGLHLFGIELLLASLLLPEGWITTAPAKRAPWYIRTWRAVCRKAT